jgi:hypothetical protein
MQALCIKEEDMFLMLKRLVQEDLFEVEYLMVPLEVYKSHEKYFKDSKYEKHNTFGARYIKGMEVMGVPVIREMEGYERPSGCYLVNSNIHISDFERVQAQNIPHQNSFITDLGEYVVDNEKTGIFLNDIKLTKKL